MLSFQGGIRVPSYTASKSGLAGLTKLLANEWAGKGINVNAIAPGYFVDQQHRRRCARMPTRNADILARIPAGRWGNAVRSRRRGRVPGIGARPTTCMARSCPSTAAGWRADRSHADGPFQARQGGSIASTFRITPKIDFGFRGYALGPLPTASAYDAECEQETGSAQPPRHQDFETGWQIRTTRSSIPFSRRRTCAATLPIC